MLLLSLGGLPQCRSSSSEGERGEESKHTSPRVGGPPHACVVQVASPDSMEVACFAGWCLTLSMLTASGANKRKTGPYVMAAYFGPSEPSSDQGDDLPGLGLQHHWTRVERGGDFLCESPPMQFLICKPTVASSVSGIFGPAHQCLCE